MWRYKIEENKNRQSKKEDNNYVMYGMTLEMCIETSFDVIFNHIVIGIAIRLALGLGVGAILNIFIKNKYGKI